MLKIPPLEPRTANREPRTATRKLQTATCKLKPQSANRNLQTATREVQTATHKLQPASVFATLFPPLYRAHRLQRGGRVAKGGSVVWYLGQRDRGGRPTQTHTKDCKAKKHLNG